MNKILILIILLIVYCSIHSILIAIPVTSFFKRKLGIKYAWYRLSFNLFSFFTLIPVLYFAYTLESKNIFQWQGNLIYVQLILIISGILIIYAGSRGYSFKQFSGILQAQTKSLNENDIISDGLSTSGILSYIRHPWYTGVIVLLWSRNLNTASLVVNIIFTLYFFIGAFFEEKKLVLAFGDEYKKYKKTVSMFFPLKGILKAFRKN